MEPAWFQTTPNLMEDKMPRLIGLPMTVLFGLLLMTGPVAGGGPEVAALLPADTQALVSIPSVETIYRHLAVTEKTIFGEPIDDIDDIRESLGFNPFSLTDLKANGIDTARSIGVAMTGFRVSPESQEPSMNLALCLPAADAGKVMTRFQEIIRKDSPEVVLDQDGGMTRFSHPDEKMTGYFFEKGGYVFLTANPAGDSRPLAQAIRSDQPALAKSKRLADILADVPSDNRVFAFARVAKLLEGNLDALAAMVRKQAAEDEAAPVGPDIGKNLENLKDCETAGLSIDFTGSDLAGQGAFRMLPGARALKAVSDLRFDKRVVLGMAENPLLLLSAAVNPTEYYRMIVETLPEEQIKTFRSALEGIKADYGIDVESEVIGNLAGNINLGIYDGVSINMMNINLVLTLNLRDPAKMQGVLDKVVAKIPPEQQSMVVKAPVNGVDAYVVSLMGMAQIYVGIQNQTLIVTVGKPMFEKALAADPAKGFLTRMTDEALVSALTRDLSSIFYLDAQETFLAVKNFSAFLQQAGGEGNQPIITDQVSSAVDRLDYFLTTTRVREQTFLSDILVKTRFDVPFFEGIRQIAAAFEQAETPADDESEAPTTSPEKGPAAQ